MRHLPERDRPILARMRRAWAETDSQRALEQLTLLAAELAHTHPGAARSLREGPEKTLTGPHPGLPTLTAADLFAATIRRAASDPRS